MTRPPESASPAPGAAGAREGGDAAPAIRDLLALLEKAVRAFRLYRANNPVYRRFLDGLRAAFADLWLRLPAVRLEVEEAGFVWEGETIPAGAGRDNLAFLFYKDGVRYLTFLPGFEDELERFLGVVVRARHLQAEEDDLVTLLWEQDFAAFQYGYVDVLAEGLELPVSRPNRLDPLAADVLAAETRPAGAPGADGAPAAERPPPGGVLAPDGFNETPHFLDPEELDLLRAELDDEWARDPKADVLNALFDRLEDPATGRQTEILGIFRQILPAFLARGDLVSAANILQELDALLERKGVLGEEQRAQVDALFDELSEPAMVGQLLQALEVGGIDPGAGELSLFLARLRPSALPALIRAIEAAPSAAVRERVHPAVERLARQHPAALARLLLAGEDAVAAGAARTAGRLHLAGAVPALVRLLERPAPALRLAAVEALVALRTPAALDALRRALGDENRDVRIAVARGLGSVRYAPARPSLEERIGGRAVRDADLTEKLAFFEAYADVGGDEAVPCLDRLLNGRGVLGRRHPPELRACAAMALGRIASPAARACLERASGDTDPIVRSAVLRGLRTEVAAS